MSFFLIPGNIKQQFAPFVLNPSSKLHNGEGINSSTDLKDDISPLYFTYKDKNGEYSSGIAKLNFFPTSLDSIKIKDDISFKLLYSRSSLPEYMSNKSITLSDLLNLIPGVLIREFLPDTRLDLCINFFKDLIENMSDLIKKDDSKKSTDNAKKGLPADNAKKGLPADKKSKNGLMKKITAVADYTLKYIIGATNPDFFDDLGTIPDLPFSSYKHNIYNSYTFGSAPHSPGYYVMTFPYTLYYRLLSCVTTNIYEIPATPTNKMIMSSLGSAGWTDGGDDFMSSGGFRISNLLGKIPGIGLLANMIIGNIGVNYMPWWNAGSGSKTKEQAVEITFDLYNDNLLAAINNFIFVNTIVPNNRWIQYNMFLHSSNLYDVKIEGINRLFACAGDFTVTYEGILREPTDEFYSRLRKHFNKNIEDWQFYINLCWNKIIKIPDIYRVKLNFLSLLPANFNNFIFNYAENSSHIKKYSGHVYDGAALSKLLPNAIGKYIKRIKNVWEEGKEEAANKVK